MAQPLILSLLNDKKVSPADLAIVTGSSSDKNKAAIEKLLAPYHHIGVRIGEKTPPTDLLPPDYLIYCAKPQQVATIVPQYVPFMKPGTVFITIAGGLEISSYTALLPAGIEVIRAMPHLPKKLIGIYAQQQETGEHAASLLSGLGNPVFLAQEAELHAYTVHAGSGPAFLAQFLATQKSQKPCAEFFKTLNKNASTPQSAVAFYYNWLQVAQDHLGDEAKRILQATFRGTIEHLEDTGIDPADFAQQVRSPNGITHAGLLVMENSTLPPEETIAPALQAALARSKEMARELL